MSDAWGGSWGTSWSASWGAGAAPEPEAPGVYDVFGGHGGGVKRRRKRDEDEEIERAVRKRDEVRRLLLATWAELTAPQAAPAVAAAPEDPPTPEEILRAPAIWPSLVPLAMQLTEIARQLATLRQNDDEEAVTMLLMA